MRHSMATSYKDQRLTWTTVKPGRSGWYWMLNPHEQPGLPTIVQIEHDWESGRFVALIPASHYPKVPSAVVDPENIDSLWAGPLAIPSIACESLRRFPITLKAEWEADIAV